MYYGIIYNKVINKITERGTKNNKDETGKNVVLAALCVMIGLGSVMPVKAADTQCPNCYEHTLREKEIIDGYTTIKGVKCEINGHIDCYVDFTYIHVKRYKVCDNCGYSKYIGKREDLVDEKHYCYV